ncbi:uncharacterized protein LOC113564522 [Drosophila erecta]|uniref:uncharacterized protein LOC113564522 n=1 Tax=Drosophila erecta TaxID=7220 RepID=UPI000F058F46|nr:uncharacterized protein LOC113564522 [Drosophila erecta]
MHRTMRHRTLNVRETRRPQKWQTDGVTKSWSCRWSIHSIQIQIHCHGAQPHQHERPHRIPIKYQFNGSSSSVGAGSSTAQQKIWDSYIRLAEKYSSNGYIDKSSTSAEEIPILIRISSLSVSG